MPAGTPLFDRGLMAERRQRRHQPDANILTRTIAEELVERLSLINRRFDTVLLIAAEPEHIAARLKGTKQVGDITTRLPSISDNLDLPTEQFDAVLSVDAVKIFKPAPQVYELAVKKLGVPKERIGFVSSNCWDALGAKSYGFTVYWINRAGAPLDRLGFAPDGVLKSLGDLPEILR